MTQDLQEIYKQGAWDRCAELQVNPEANDLLAAIQNNPGALHNMGDFAGGTALFPKQASAGTPEDLLFQDVYAEGFAEKCAAYGLDPEAVVLYAEG